MATPASRLPVSFRLPASVIAVMKRLAAQRECSLAQVLRDAVSTEAMLQGLSEEGGKILLMDPEGTTRLLVWNRGQGSISNHAKRKGH